MLNLNPGAVVDDVSVQVRVVDPQGVIEATASDYVTKNRVSDTEVLFSYSPTAEQQKEDLGSLGLGRDLTIEFDVNPSPDDAGVFIVDVNCYFAQFFSPAGVSVVPVDLVFVIDVSGSMSGTKISQTRQALETIIKQLRSTDRFTMLTFSTTVSYWRQELVSAVEYRQQAIQFAQNLQAGGSTNFNDGVLGGAEVLKTYGNSDYVPLLVVLTDGEPTVGVTDEDAIIENVRAALAGTSISLNCLGFGDYLNYELLEKLALQNNGIVRRIYEAEDAPDQLEGFFEEISSPVLRDIQISYDIASINSISTTEFPLLFAGGEIVVAGQCDNASPEISVEIIGTGEDGVVTYETDFSTTPSNIIGGYTQSTERLLAYLLIQQLLDTRFTLSDEFLIKANLEEALRLSLEYNFVTELTSLIVVEDIEGSGNGGNGSLIGGNNGGGGEDEFDSNYPSYSFPYYYYYDDDSDVHYSASKSVLGCVVPSIAAILLLPMIANVFVY